MKRSIRITIVIVILALGLMMAKDVRQAQAGFGSLVWPDGSTFTTYGPNRIVKIGTGFMTFLGYCPTGGIADFLYPWTDIYVVEAGTVNVGDDLEDVNNIPNTALGASGGIFVDEVIAITQPSGSLGPGTYAVVYDECQDGKFDAVDTIFDPAFEVVIDPDMPELVDPALVAFKETSVFQQLYWEDIVTRYEWVLEIAELAGDFDGDVPTSVSIGPDDVKDAIIDELKGKAKSKLNEAFNTFDPNELPIIFAGNMAKHYQAIAADPPDSNFEQLTPLGARTVIDPQSDQALYIATAEMGTAVSTEEMLAAAMLASMERYQGAQEAGNGEWGLVHARAMRAYAAVLAQQLNVSSASLSNLETVLQADGTNLDNVSTAWENYRVQIASSGFISGEVQLASNLGLTSAEINELKLDIIADEQTGFDKASAVAALAAAQTNNTAMQSDLTAFIGYLDTLIADLEANTLVSDQHPVADAGGPYLVAEGASITFDAAASTSPTSITGYAWDLDGDGAFDDGTGPAPSYTYNQAFNGLVGVQVTNQIGKQDIAYALIEVTNVNSPPAFTTNSPAALIQELEVGDSLSFSATATDPDGDTVTYEWRVDYQSVGSGPNFNYTPAPADVGLRLVEVIVDDGNPLGGTVSYLWGVAVYGADVDGDGWHQISDCDDGDPAINPGQSEILFNTIDDDCNANTPDSGSPAEVKVLTDIPLGQFQIPPTEMDEGFYFGLNTTFTDTNPANTHTAVIDWGDGLVETGVISETAGIGTVAGSHAYGDNGFYTISVCVTDDEGATGCGTHDVKVLNAPPGAFLADLSTWTDECYDVGIYGENVDCIWVLSPDNTRATQLTNGVGSLFYSDFELEGEMTITGQVRVTASGDDDMFGFAFGFEPGDTTNPNADYYLYDWKANWQWGDLLCPNSTVETPFLGDDIMTFSHVFGVPDFMEFWSRSDIQIRCLDDSAGVVKLDTQGDSWVVGKTYNYVIEYSPTNISIWTNSSNWPPDANKLFKVIDVDGSYSGGRLAFYTLSQANVDFSGFAVQPTYEITEGEALTVDIPFNDKGVLDTHTSLIDWGDGSPLNDGQHTASNGSGQIAGQHIYQDDGTYSPQVCVTDDDGETTCGDLNVIVSNAAPVVDAGPDQLASGLVTLAPATFSDPGVLDTHTATIDWGDGTVISGTVAELLGSGTVGGSHTYTGDGTFTVDVCVTDSDGATGCDSLDVQALVTPAAAVVAVNGASFGEGDVFSNTVFFTDTNPSDIHTGTIDWGDGSTIEPLIVLNEQDGFGLALPEHQYLDNGTYPVAVELCDDGGQCGQAGTVNTIANLPPAVTASAAFTSDADLVNVTLATFSDPGILDTHTSSINWGDGTPDEAGAVSETNGAGSISSSHSFGGEGDYTVTICVTDKDNATTCDSLVVTVLIPNSPPQINQVLIPSTILEGTNATIDISATDPDGDPLTYRFDCDNDGTYETGPQAANTSTCFFDDNGQYTVNVEAADVEGLTDASSVLVDVQNVSPTAIFNTPASVNEGSSFLVNLTNPSDPSVADTNAGFEYAFDCGNGLTPYSSTPSHNCNVDDNGTATIDAHIRDKDGGEQSYSADVQVLNLAPTAHFTPPPTAFEGTSFSLSVSNAADPSPVDLSAGLLFAFDCGSGFGAFDTTPSTTCPVVDDNTTLTVQAAVLDKDGGQSVYAGTLDVQNVPPSGVANIPTSVDEGASFTLELTAPWDVSNADTAAGFQYAFDCGSGLGAYSASSSTTCNTDDNGSLAVSIYMKDKDGGESSWNGTVNVNNVAPTAVFSAPATLEAGESGLLSFSGQLDPSGADTTAGFTYAYDCDGDGTFEANGLTSPTHSCVYPVDGAYAAAGQIYDKDGDYTEYSAPINVNLNNLPPVVGPITAPIEPVPAGESINVTAVFTDPNVLDTHTAVWSWDDGTTSAGVVTESGGSGTVSGDHAYTDPGVYTIGVTVTDNLGASGDAFYQFVVVFDPDGGFVTGGGWIISDAGWCQLNTLCANAEGRANFGFVSKYKRGASVPTGNTEFNFSSGVFNFHSEEYDWLVVNQGGKNAQFKGTGTINGNLARNGEAYHFMIWVTDNDPGGVDTFRIKIWYEDGGSEIVVYDNGFNQPIDGGNIKVHK